MKLRPVWILGMCLTVTTLARSPDEPTVIPLWPHGAPGSEARRNEPEVARDYWVRNIHNPSLTVFRPPPGQANGTAIIVIPGGGHRELVFNAEGVQPATFLAKLGMTAFALKYRLAREEGSTYTIEKDARADAVRAMRYVRSHAAEWGVDPHRIGLMGWSAGGELTALVVYRPTEGDPNAVDPVERVSCRPDFQIMIYPGAVGLPEVIGPDAPPAFLLCAGDDRDHAGTTMTYARLLWEAKVPVELHVFAQGQHAFNMGDRSTLRSIHDWPHRLADWLADSGWLEPAKSAR